MIILSGIVQYSTIISYITLRYIIYYINHATSHQYSASCDPQDMDGSHGTDYNRHSRNLPSLYYQGATGTEYNSQSRNLMYLGLFDRSGSEFIVY